MSDERAQPLEIFHRVRFLELAAWGGTRAADVALVSTLIGWTQTGRYKRVYASYLFGLCGGRG